MGDANALSRSDHETQVDTKLVRKRTQAKMRSDERRTQQQQYQQQQQQYQQQPPMNYNGAPSDRRQSSTPASYGASSVRRRDTLRQVEAAAGRPMHMQSGTEPAPMTPTMQSSGHGQHRQSWQLQDRPVSRVSAASKSSAATSLSSSPAPGRQQSIPVQQHAQKPATFAEVRIGRAAPKCERRLTSCSIRWASRRKLPSATSASSCEASALWFYLSKTEFKPQPCNRLLYRIHCIIVPSLIDIPTVTVKIPLELRPHSALAAD